MSAMMRILCTSVVACVPMIMVSAAGFGVRANPGDPPLPLIVNNTLYSGLDGHKLRGDHKEVVWDTRTLTPSTWDEKKDILFNFRRVDGNKPTTSGEPYKANTDPVLWRDIDSCVNMAARAGQYMELLYGGIWNQSAEGGGGFPHHWEFWRMAAPRYKNRSHVIYSLKNEPSTGWLWDSSATGCAAMAKMVRDSAPNSFFFPGSTPDGASIPISNAYVAFTKNYLARYKVPYNYGNSGWAFHGYGDMSLADNIHNRYPCMEDEVPNGNFGQIQMMEQKKIAWCYFDGKQAWDATSMKNDASSKGYAWWITPKLAVDTNTLSIAGRIGSPNPPAVTVLTANDGGGTLADLNASIAFQDGNGWLAVQRAGTGNLQVLTNSVSSNGMAAGVYHATVTVTASNSTPPSMSYKAILTLSDATGVQSRTPAAEIQGARLLAHTLVAGGPFVTKVHIANAQGRTVRAETFAGVKQVDLANLKPGVYQASVRTPRGTQTMEIAR